MMPLQKRRVQQPSPGKLLLYALGVVYLIYLVAFGRLWYMSMFAPAPTIVDHAVDTSAAAISSHWTADAMRSAIGFDEQDDNPGDFTQGGNDTSAGQAAQQQGQPPSNGDPGYHLSTVGKVFMTNASGQDMVCSGTAIVSLNHNVVDTAGHCLYWSGNWVRNVIFCPLYENGNRPYGCWIARDLEVPSDWIGARPNDLHHDFGMAIVSPNEQGDLTDVVGGAGWAYNQPTRQSFYAYGYPAAYPFDGQTRKSCENATGKSWPHGGGTVISIPCDMTGGSSGGPWFVQASGNWYVNGHNDFTSTAQRGHMFSPYYDDTWYALYNKAQHT